VTDNGIVLLTKGEGAPNTWEKNAVSYGNVKTFTAASTDKNAQATVENTPGAALPHTGGSGTMLYYLMGLMLIAVAGIGAVMKLRLGR
jgi:LPXTG-motif cell wall-anchored protein